MIDCFLFAPVFDICVCKQLFGDALWESDNTTAIAGGRAEAGLGHNPSASAPSRGTVRSSVWRASVRLWRTDEGKSRAVETRREEICAQVVESKARQMLPFNCFVLKVEIMCSSIRRFDGTVAFREGRSFWNWLISFDGSCSNCDRLV